MTRSKSSYFADIKIVVDKNIQNYGKHINLLYMCLFYKTLQK